MGKNNKDKGFTLIELVVSVAILAIVTAPLLNSFVIAAKNNATASARQTVTNHSESIMEKFKATSFEMLTEEYRIIDKAVVDDYEGEKYYYYDEVNDYYVFNVPGTEFRGEQASKYNATVKMTPQKYNAPNLADVDGEKTAMFISEMYKYDDIALSELESQMRAIPDNNQKYNRYWSSNPDASDNLRKRIERISYITITYGSGTAPYSVQLDMVYKCKVGTGKTVTKTYEKIFLNNYENVPDILVFYTPYPYVDAEHLDKVYINNAIPTVYIPRNDKCKIYIANQQAAVKLGKVLKYNRDSSGHFIFQEEGNNKDAFADGATNGLINTEVYMSESISTSSQDNSLVGIREEVKMYDITVDVFWNGDLMSSVSSSTDGQN